MHAVAHAIGFERVKDGGFDIFFCGDVDKSQGFG